MLILSDIIYNSVALALLLTLLFLFLSAPKLLALTLWPVIMLYPHALTYGMLPLNMGFDDLYISAVCILVSPRLGRPSVSYPMKAALVFFCILFVANLIGLATVPEEISRSIIKELLKSLGLMMFTWTVLISITEKRDISLHIVSFIVSMMAASAIAGADYFGLPFAKLFYIPQEGELHFRATGPFLSPAGLGIATMMPIFISLAGTTIKGLNFTKIFFAFGAAIIFAALFLSGSRSGWLGFFVGISVMFIMTRQRSLLVISSLMVILIAIEFLGIQTIQEVIQVNVARTETGVGGLSAGRFQLWKSYLEHPYLAMLLCGRGMIATRAIGFNLPHSGYLDAVFILGLGGTAFFIVSLYRVLRLSKWMAINDSDPLQSVFSQGIFVGVVAWLGVALPADPILNTFWRYTFFFIITILWSRQEMLQTRGLSVPFPTRSVSVKKSLNRYAFSNRYASL